MHFVALALYLLAAACFLLSVFHAPVGFPLVETGLLFVALGLSADYYGHHRVVP